MPEYVIALVQDKELLEFIAENTWQYYLEQNTETSYTEPLRSALADVEKVEKAIANLLKAIEVDIFNEATKQRMDELDGQRQELKNALAAAKLKEDLGLKKEHILYFLHRFSEMDYADESCQKRLPHSFSAVWQPLHMDAIHPKKEADLHCKPASFCFSFNWPWSIVRLHTDYLRINCRFISTRPLMPATVQLLENCQ